MRHSRMLIGTRIRGAQRKPTLAVLLLLAISLATTGCLVPPTSVVGISPPNLPDGPDPAAQAFFGWYQIYTTEANYMNIPTYSWNPFNHQSGNAVDAMPQRPGWVSQNPHVDPQFWAPSVHYVDGRYLMMFSAQLAGHSQHCIGAATSSNGLQFQPANGFYLCDEFQRNTNLGGGNFDPYIFLAPNGGLWMLYSEQSRDAPVFSGGSAIIAQQLTTDGLGLYGGPHLLVQYSDVASFGGGPNPQVENPAIVADGNGYDLLVSVGTWNQDNTYSTVEIPCQQPWGGCTQGVPIMQSGGIYGLNPGGASLGGDGPGSIMFWHATNPVTRNRADFAGVTSNYP